MAFGGAQHGFGGNATHEVDNGHLVVFGGADAGGLLVGGRRPRRILVEHNFDIASARASPGVDLVGKDHVVAGDVAGVGEDACVFQGLAVAAQDADLDGVVGDAHRGSFGDRDRRGFGSRLRSRFGLVGRLWFVSWLIGRLIRGLWFVGRLIRGFGFGSWLGLVGRFGGGGGCRFRNLGFVGIL